MTDERRWAVVFDLDETLVLTSALEPLRRTRNWQKVYAAFDRTSLPRGTQGFLERISQKVQIAVVTKAPRRYAEKLLAHHGLNVPVIVAFHDVRRVKPDPEALLLASKKLGIDPSRCIHVGDDENDVRAARSAGFTPIGVCWGETIAVGLDRICTRWDEVYDEIMGLAG
jgi:HAD superfamily hydrolase (TIGR01509 family)